MFTVRYEVNLQIEAELTFGSEGSMYDELSEIILGVCTVLPSTAVTSSRTINPRNCLIYAEIMN